MVSQGRIYGYKNNSLLDLFCQIRKILNKLNNNSILIS